MPPDEFRPNSFTAQLATIIAKQEAMKDALISRLDSQDTVLARIETQAMKTNGRVSTLERWRDMSSAKLAGISITLGIVGSLLGWLFQVVRGS